MYVFLACVVVLFLWIIWCFFRGGSNDDFFDQY